MNILSIPLADIESGDRLREIDPDYARLLADSLNELGQLHPIEVRATPKAAKPYTLILGGHRLAAARLLSWVEIDATVFDGNALEARLREIDENLVRHELTQLDRAVFLAERKVIWEQVHPETRHGGDRSDQVHKLSTWSFSKEAALRLGFSEGDIRRSVLRHNRLHPDVRRRLTGTWLANHGAQLDALAKASVQEQQSVVALLFGEVVEGFERPANVAAALRQVRGVMDEAPDPEAEQWEAFLRLWKRMPAGVRRRVRAHVSARGEAT